jgi:hypothetical protein
MEFQLRARVHRLKDYVRDRTKIKSSFAAEWLMGGG